MRKDWDNYFLDIAEAIATRATCDRLHVGAVLVKDKRIVATGYNGSLSGDPHCSDEGHLLENNSCQRVVHAEVNAVCQAARLGISTNGADLYCTHAPCWNCTKTILSAGISKIYYRHGYKTDPRVTSREGIIRIYQPHASESNNK